MLEKQNCIETFYRLEAKSKLSYVGNIVAGFPSPAEDYMDKCISLDSLLIENKSATILGRVVGYSMVDANLEDGDVLVIDRSKTAVHGDIVICRLNGEFTCKRLEIIGANEKIFLVPENEKFPKIEIGHVDDFLVEGVVTYVIKKISIGKKWRL